MKRKLLLLTLLCSQIGFSQITITSSDMPSAGDTARRTQAPIQLGLNYQATGANHTWNFTNLRYQAQQVDTFLSVSSTNFLYALFFSNLPFNTNRANVATNGQAFPANPFITITDPYNFYYRSSTDYRQVGLGASFQGIPLPVAYTQKDKIYEFPLNYGDVDTSVSAWNVALPSLIYYGSNQTRINEVDGWGTLNTPYGTYQALRVKTTLIASDTISIDTLNLGLNIDRPLTREYKWLANGDIVPVLQITTTEIFGIEIVNSILFRDVVPNVTPGILPTAICAGSTLQLPFTEQGTFNAGTLFSAGNKFTAQLSDASGDFSNAVNIGDTTSNQSGNFSVVIPANTPAGNGYRIRITSSNPAVTGADNGIDIRIDNGLPAASTIQSNSSTSLCIGDSIELAGSAVTDAVYQWTLNNTALTGETALNLYAVSGGNYLLQTINSCGATSSNLITITLDSLPAASSIIAAGNTTFCTGDSVVLNGSLLNGVQYQWAANGIDITGATAIDLTVNQAGIYTLNTTNNCGTTSSNSIAVTVDSLPQAAAVTSASGLIFCAGDSLLLNGSTVNGATYQWQESGNDISGATAINIYVSQSGIYSLNTINNCGVSTSNTLSVTAEPLPPTPVIISSNDTLFTAGGYSYAWYFNGTLIQGAVDSVLIATTTGVYEVVITSANSCSSTSLPFNYVASGINNGPVFSLLNLYPNPAQELLNVEVKENGFYTLEIISADGKLVMSTQQMLELKSVIMLSSTLENGTYLLRISNEKSVYQQPFILNR
ncbi:MAG: T9SS type A sorting domain-containing protein [Bacteroidetes bacterium]|nr:T9SS type A sorting domain-containing protein [Bacteroidota bacterium]